jgi:tetratricopeptide (TPR) repeat protein
LLALLAATGSVASAETHGFPSLPTVKSTDFLPEVREQVKEAYERAREHPDSAEDSGKLGMLLDLYHRPAEAAACYERAHRLAPRAFKWLYYLGSLQAAQGERAQAAVTLRAALELRPHDLPTLLKLGDDLYLDGKAAESEQIYADAVRRYPAAAEAYYGLGRISAGRDETAAAARYFREACELFPRYGAAHYALAQLDRRLGRAEDARQEMASFAASQSLVPPVSDPLRDELRALDRAAPSLLERGVQLEQAGRIQDAIAAHERALQLDPDLVMAHVNLIILYGKAGEFQKAEAQFQAAVALSPDKLPDAYYNHGVLLMEEGKLDEAQLAFRKALEIEPTYADAHNDLGYLLERRGKLEEAAAEYRAAVENKPDFRQAHFNLGRILVNQYRYPEAIEQFKQTLTPVDQHTPSYLYALGATYGRAGDDEDALHYLGMADKQAKSQGQTQLEAQIQKDLQRLKASPGSP